MSQKIYRTTSWYDARVEIRSSLIQGGGMFARRPIQTGEIVAMMGRTVMTEDEFHQPCLCGTTACRHTITGNDWQLPEVQRRYQGHFAPFINERIRKSKQS